MSIEITIQQDVMLSLEKLAGKYLKSVCGWVGHQIVIVPLLFQLLVVLSHLKLCDEDYISYDTHLSMIQMYQMRRNANVSNGVDKYGMSILPSGVVTLDGYERPQASAFGEKSVMWTTSHVYGDAEQDRYVKVFDWNKVV